MPGRSRAVPAEVAECLKKRLSEPEGFGSYGEPQIWIRENYNPEIRYKTVHKTVRYCLEAGPKTQRPSHTKKNEDEVREFKEPFPDKISEPTYNNDKNVKIFSYGETGSGLITSPGKRITLRGVRPVGLIQRTFENCYIYGAANVADGENFFPGFLNMDTDCFQCFIDEFSKHFQNSMNIMLIDNAGIHKAERLIIPENIRLPFLPPYSPELNHIERFWQYIKQHTKGKIFSGLPEMKDCVADILIKCFNKMTASLTGFSYILDAINV